MYQVLSVADCASEWLLTTRGSAVSYVLLPCLYRAPEVAVLSSGMACVWPGAQALEE